MEISVSSRQKISNPEDVFTFQTNTMNDDQGSDQNFEFKFESASSDSPGSPYKDSPADHLFCNGVMLPHSFPVQPMYYYYGSERRSYQRSTSRTSSVGSKDSFLSSRSNSTNSRSSSFSSSARTSLSDSSERMTCCQNNAMRRYYLKKAQQQRVLDHVYASSRRWQFITPMPVTSQETSWPQKAKNKPQGDATAKKKNDTKKKVTGAGSWFVLRFFRYILSVCKECHAVEPSSVRRRAPSMEIKTSEIGRVVISDGNRKKNWEKKDEYA